MFVKIKPLSSLAPGQAPDSNTLYTNAQGQLVTNAASDGGAANVSLVRTWDSAGLVATDTASKAGSSVTYTRTITVTTARNLSTWTAISPWTASDGGEVPESVLIPGNALMLDGEPLMLDGGYLKFA